MDKKGIGGLVIVLVVGLIAGGFGGGNALAHNGAVQENEETTGIVQSTEVDMKIVEDSDGGSDKKYRPVITYTYEVDGRTYEHDNVFPGSFTRWRGAKAWAREIAAEYENGDEVTVQYNPRDNSHAYVRNDGLPGEWILGAGYAVFASIYGAVLIWQGFKRRKQRTLMKDTPSEDTESLSMGPSEIKGKAVTQDKDSLRAPFTGDDCVLAKWEIEEYSDDHDDDGGSWHTVEKDIRFTEFYVDDGTGAALVRPHEDATFELEDEDWNTINVDSSERGPQPVQQFVESRDDIGYPSGGAGRDGDRRYKQNLIRPNEDVYVFGTVQPRDGTTGTSNVENLVIEKVGEDDPRMEPMFMISDDKEQELINARRWALWRMPVGIIFVVGGVGLVLGIAGPKIGITLPIPPKLLTIHWAFW